MVGNFWLCWLICVLCGLFGRCYWVSCGWIDLLRLLCRLYVLGVWYW